MTATDAPMLAELEGRAEQLRLRIDQAKEKLRQSQAEFDRVTPPAEQFFGGRRPQDWDSFLVVFNELRPTEKELNSVTQLIAEIRAAQNQ